MIDTHCHLLPRIDDGPKTTTDAVRLARRLRDEGITSVVCTPTPAGVSWLGGPGGSKAVEGEGAGKSEPEKHRMNATRSRPRRESSLPQPKTPRSAPLIFEDWAG